MNFSSCYLQYTNKELDWLPMDTEELYKKNLKVNYNLLKKNNWVNSKFTYKFNSYGFRTNEFTEKPSIMFLGCSNTIGIGLPVEDTWASITSKKINLECVNLAIGGSSPDTAFRLCYGYIKKINPKIVVYLEPPLGRLEIVKEDHYHHNIISGNTIKYDVFYKQWILEETNILMNCEKNLFGIKELCRMNDTKLLHFNFELFRSLSVLDDFARDLAHFGRLTNQQMAEHVLTFL